MAYSDVAICNLALGKIGENAIVALTDNTKSGIWCNRFFDHVKNTVLDLFDWSPCIERDTLAVLAAAPEYEYSYQYQLPNDCLHVISVYGEPEYRIEGDQLLCDTPDQVQIRYVRDPGADVNGLGALLIEAIASRLAASLAIPLAGSQGVALKGAMDQEFASALLLAKWKDNRNKVEPNKGSDLWIDALENDSEDS